MGEGAIFNSSWIRYSFMWWFVKITKSPYLLNNCHFGTHALASVQFLSQTHFKWRYCLLCIEGYFSGEFGRKSSALTKLALNRRTCGQETTTWLEICQKFYTTIFLDRNFYTIKTRTSGLFSPTVNQRKCINISYLVLFCVKIYMNV